MQALSNAIALPLLLVPALSGVAQERPETGSGASIAPALGSGVERAWIGPEFWANRLQDWRLRDGRLVCVEGRPRFPLRTLHLLTAEITGAGGFEVAVDIAPSTEHDLRPGSFVGFLFGAGGAHVDPRLTAQVHHRPAEDGGILVGLDDQGRLAVLGNDRPAPGGNTWSLGGALPGDALERIAGSTSRYFTVGSVSPRRLRVRVEPDVNAVGRFRLTAEVSFVGFGDHVVQRLTAAGLERERIDGGLALVSHLGPVAAAGEHRAGFAFENLDVPADGTGVVHRPERAFGPVLGVQYTVGEVGRGPDRHAVWKLTAQLPPLEPGVQGTLELEAEDPRGEPVWRPLASSVADPDSHTLRFRVEPWDSAREARFRVAVRWTGADGKERVDRYGGRVRRDPRSESGDGAGEEVVVASLNCNKNYTGGLAWNPSGLWFPHAETAAAVAVHDPDLLFFAGDQIYEGDIDPAITSPEDDALLDYLYKWTRFLWSFGELTRDRPTVTIPDDHDVYHGNLWGAGGRRARRTETLSAQDSGGYKMSPRFVNAVHRTQTSHLPDPFGPPTIGDGYTTYHTVLDYGGLSCAVLADRQYKSSASAVVPEGRVVNGWFQNEAFDPRDADVPGAVLLGDSQLAMLEGWAADYAHDVWFKVCLSQTLFTNLATIPEQAKGGAVLPSLPVPAPGEKPAEYKLAADTDSNGWPQTGRDRAVDLLRSALAVHLCGDQHLGSLVEYGLDEYRDGSFAFCAPAIANTWPRRWFPPVQGANRGHDLGLAPWYCGDFEDGFGNKMTVWAAANPVRTDREPRALYERSPGYGIVRFLRDEGETGSVIFEAWPRWVDPQSSYENFPGWPKRVDRFDARGPHGEAGPLARLQHPEWMEGMGMEVEVRVIEQETGKLHYAARLTSEPFFLTLTIHAYAPGRYQLAWRLAGESTWRVHSDLERSMEPPTLEWR